ncbi:universal stress protein [Halegenticoccus soli]|uniref:universal stress protein n=1 Tax=Halegenticoccus soli TaxID=1985678 RepID=UPI000C6EEB24|nr:universal stress protein [Halegenticoccus soli]
MDRALVVIDTSPAADLLREAGSLAQGVGAELVVLALVLGGDDADAVDEMRAALGDAGTRPPRSDAETVRLFAERVSERALGDLTVPYRVVWDVVETSRPSDRIIEVADGHDCDHVFIPGRRRSPTGKAIFGDTTQSVVLNFDGYVTVSTAE